MTTALKTEKAVFCKPHYRKIQASINLSAISELFSCLENPSILGGNSSKINADKFSYWAAKPKEIFEFQAGQKEPFKKLQQVLDKYKLDENSKLKLPEGIFCGGWLGFFSYELGRYIEKLPQTTINDLEMPLIRLCFYDRLIAYDHKNDNFWLIALQLPDEVETHHEKLDGLEKLLLKSQKIHIPEFISANFDNIDLANIKCNMSKDYYLQTVEKIKTYIYNGDVYQVNFSQRFDCDFNGKSIKLFHWQNRYNPSPYAGYIGSDNFQIVSASPEMFLTINDGLISTKPIKGTRPRINESIRDAKNFKELFESEKEKAELNMIIDLERNDIAKICQPGTRKVIQQRTIESHPTVFHAVATIAGQLQAKTTICDILKAVFPGGSITGAPKIRSMEIIDETEPTERGVYTGSIGFIGIDGNVCLNIAIRTIIIRAQKAFVQVGGGIVADSQPQAEWDETITKAKALLAGIKSVEQTG
ncbi:MAG: anthranilate synthase component I family protein [Planctomycetes bacterium]|nr:anthranilate synthase component I family protein [Planctomycetota bacterium]